MVRSLLKKRLLGGVLKNYILNADEIAPQISFTALMAGKIQLRNVRLIEERIQDALASYLPICLEVESCVARDMEVALSWKHLSSKPVVLKISEVTVEFIVHSADEAQDEHASDEAKNFWKMQAGRVLADNATLVAMAAAGALPPTLTDRVTAGLNVEIEKVTCRLRRPQSKELEAHFDLEGLRYGATSENFQWTNDLEETRASNEAMKEVQLFLRFDAQKISLSSGTGEAEISVGPLSMKEVFKSPALLPLVAPFHCTKRIDLDLGTVGMSGPEENLLVVLKVANDIYQSIQLLEKLDELSQLGEEEMVRFYTAAFSDPGEDLAGKAFCAGRDLDDDEEEEMRVLHSEMDRQAHWWKARSRNATENSAIDAMVKRRCSVSEEIETFFQLGVKSSLFDSAADTSGPSTEMTFRGRASTSADNHHGSPTALSVPEHAVERMSVHIKDLQVNVVLPEGRLTVELDDFGYTSDCSVPLTSEARSCCAKLFNMPLSTASPEASSGVLLYNLTVQALGISFLAGDHDQSSKPGHATSGSFCGEDDEYEGNVYDDAVVVRLSKGAMPALTIRTRGPAEPLCCMGMKLEPMDLTVVGLKLRQGLGLDAMSAWGSRLGAALPQVSIAPVPKVPSTCYSLRFVDSVFLQQPPPESLLCDGRWPIRFSVPLVEAKSVSSLFELPKVIKATIYPDWKIDGREWWQPVRSTGDEGASIHFSTSQAAKVQSRLVRLEKEVEYLKQEKDVSARREEKLTGELERLRRNNSMTLAGAIPECFGRCVVGMRKAASSVHSSFGKSPAARKVTFA